MPEMGSIKNANYLNEITRLNEKNNTTVELNELSLMVNPTSMDDLQCSKVNLDINDNEFGFRIEKASLSAQKPPSRCSRLMKNIFKSPQFHFTVVILVVLDCFCVSVELILDVLISNQNKKLGEKASFVKFVTLSSYKLNTQFINSYISSLRTTMNCTATSDPSVKFNDMLLSNLNHSENVVNKTDDDTEFYVLLHSIESILKYVGKRMMLCIFSFVIIENELS